MKIEKGSVARFHYAVAEAGGPELETSRERGEPLAVLVGHGNIIPGLDEALIGHEPGDRFEVEVSAAKAYGERTPELTQRVPKKYFREPGRVRPGMSTVLQTAHGPRMVTVLKVGMSVVDVDLNHPMAGKDLKFDVEIVDVREATPGEIEHGHVHGEGGVRH